MIYVADGGEHKMAIRFSAAMDILDFTVVAGIANTIAPLLAACMPATMAVSRFEVHDANHAYLWGGNTASSYAGTHGVSGSLPALKSVTVALTGKGLAFQAGYAVGQVRATWRVQNAFAVAPGNRRIVRDAPLNALAQYFINDPRIWCDFYGQKAMVRSGATIQFNAHIQRVEGS